MDLTCSAQADIETAPLAVKRSRVRAWLTPDLATVLSLFTLIWCLLFFDGTRGLFRDSDSGWHIRTGEAILEGRGLPRTDPYSFTRAGQRWFAWEWGADVLMGAAHRAGGLAYVAGLYAVALAVCTWLWVRLTWAAGGHFLIACALAAPMLTTSSIHWHARPHVFGWLLLLTAVLHFESARRSLLFVAVLGAIWANLHPSFFLLPAVALIYAAGAALARFLWEEAPDTRPSWYLRAAAFGFAASFLNPYGWHLHRHVSAYLTDSELLSRIGEFQSFNFHAEGAAQIVVAMAVSALGAAAALTARRPAHALLIALLLAMALRSARSLPLVALVCLPLANGAIAAALRNWQDLRPALRRRIDDFLAYGGNLRKLELEFTGAAPAALAVLVVLWALGLPAVQAYAGFPPETFPVHAANAATSLPADARILAPDMYGGYLIYRFAGERKVFFDGRSDFHGIGAMKDYLSLIEVRPGWREQIARMGFTHALLPNRYSLVAALERDGWTRLYSDKVATLLAAPRGR
jgi:hypothetical protein